MTGTVNGLYVTLEGERCEDDVKSLINAIRRLRGVLTVELHITDWETHIARRQAQWDLRKKIYAVLED